MKVLLVDDHSLFREGMERLFISHGITVAGMASNGLEALEQARKLRPDVILMDVFMAGCDGFVATRLIKAEMPEIKIVMLTASDDDEHLFEAVKSGACGYLLKNLEAKDLLDLLTALENGEPPLAPGLTMKLLDEFADRKNTNVEIKAPTSPLTPRQNAILALVAQGQTYQQVAEIIGFSERTVKYEIGQILKRLHLCSRTEAIAYAASIGWMKKME